MDPGRLTKGSSKKAWWICSKCNGSWSASIWNRTNGSKGKPTGCPYCCNPPLLASKDRNLELMYPDIAGQLHPVKNGSLSVKGILPFSNRKLWFVCENGHEYEMVLAARTKQGQGCPKCHKSVSRIQLRVFTEIAHFYPDAELESRRLGVEVDVLIPSLKMGVEVDGWRWHRDKVEADKRKNAVVGGNGYGLIRLREKPLSGVGEMDVFYPEDPNDGDILKAIAEILDVVEKRSGVVSHYGHPQEFYEEQRYRQLVAVRGKMPEDKTLQFRFPDVAKLWSKRNDLSPSEVRYGEHRQVWWRCKTGHEFQAGIWNMIAAFQRGSASGGCPYCSGRRSSSEDNLALAAPHLVGQWNSTRNGDIRPEDFLSKSNKRVWWVCDKGHEWEAVISTRFSGCGCPVCYGRKISGFKTEIGNVKEERINV